ncbi:MAG: DUF504 domain-containing protein [archaeon]
MIPIRKLLDKIKWDSKEQKQDYEISYLDRITGEEIRVGYDRIKEYDNEFFELEGSSIPLHRIKKVYKKGKLIWERKH